MNEEVKNDEQAAVAEDPKEDQTDDSSAEGGTAQDDDDGLDELLKEFDQKREAAAAQKEPTPVKEPKGKTGDEDLALATLEHRLNETEAREQRRELEGLFSRISKGTAGDDLQVEAYLNAVSRREPRINQAYQNRGENPKAWDNVEKKLKQDFEKRWGRQVDKAATEGRDSVASAVRSASTAAPKKDYSQQEIMSASKDEFDEMQRKIGITPV